jgi:RHS repeat-associated protein
VVTASNRVVLERREYEPYGRQLTPVPVDGPGYTGHVYDAATGMVYMQARYYDPELERFPSVDPVSATSVGGNFNRYWYANNNPYRFTDPDGRRPDCNACDNWSDAVAKIHKEGRQDELKPFEAPAIVATAVMAAPVVALVGVEAAMAAMANPETVIAAGEIAAGAAGVTGTAGGLGPVLKGQAGVAQSVAAATARGEQVLGSEITVAAGNVTTRPDLLVRQANGALKFIESKCGGGACLSPNQRAGFPVIEAGGAVPRGANAAAAGLKPGQPLGPTEVQVDWWP